MWGIRILTAAILPKIPANFVGQAIADELPRWLKFCENFPGDDSESALTQQHVCPAEMWWERPPEPHRDFNLKTAVEGPILRLSPHFQHVM
jgi:hypothetical protein